jgi:hypothetical protein
MVVMGLCLVLTLAVGTAALIWSGPPYTDTLRFVASGFAWLFAVLLLISFFLAVVDERAKVHGRPSSVADGPEV